MRKDKTKQRDLPLLSAVYTLAIFDVKFFVIACPFLVKCMG